MTQEEFFKRYTYDIDNDRIGGGGFGTVYKAKDNTLHKEVAIKVSQVLVKTTEDGGKKTFSLKNEVEALSHIPEHPNIANYEKDKLFSFKTQQGKFDYAVMQYYPDGNLGNAIKQGLTAEQKEDIAIQLLEGIGFLHQHNVVHRDLKPANILIAKEGKCIIPLITDFGLSKAVDFSEGSMFDNSYNAGTPKYSSPEQLQGKKIRLNTDLWSYGAILYELFTGEQLFSAGSGAANSAQADMEIYNKIVNGNVQSLGKMPEKWRKVAERCLVVDPTKRAKDAAELFAIIKGEDDETEITEGSTSGSRVSTPSSKEASGPTPPFKGDGGIKKDNPTPIHKPIHKKALWIGLGIAAVVAVALFFVLTRLDSVKSVDVTGSANGHYYVDLGLPSGTLWATCNIGANNPEDYGNYYAWGETKPQPGTTYTWSSYKYAKGNNDKLTKYCNKSDYGNNGFTDYLPALQSIDDPSVANWGNGWRTPSKSQWDELFANTTNKWATKNGVKGRLFTSKKNGKSFFLPSAGNRRDSELSYDGSYGYYWTCSLNSDYPYGAWNIYFNSDYCRVNYDNRSRGFSVRPVREK